MTKQFDMKNIEYARQLAREYKEGLKVQDECSRKLDELGLDYNAKKLILRHPDLEFVEIKSCGIKYLTDEPVDVSHSLLMSTKVTPKPDGKVLVEVTD